MLYRGSVQNVPDSFEIEGIIYDETGKIVRRTRRFWDSIAALNAAEEIAAQMNAVQLSK